MDILKIQQTILIGQETMVGLPLVEQVPVQIIPMELKKVLVHCTYKMSSQLQQAKNFYKFSINFYLTYQHMLSDSWDCTLPTSGSGAIKLGHAQFLCQSFLYKRNKVKKIEMRLRSKVTSSKFFSSRARGLHA